MEITVHCPRLIPEKQQGMILLFTLGCFCIISYLVLLQCERILLQQRYLNSFIDKQRTLTHMEMFAHHMMKKPLAQWPSTCIHNALDAPTNEKNPVRCATTYKKTPLHYFFEQLPPQACLQIYKDNKRYSTDIWRITIYSDDTKTMPQQNYLQMYVMSPALLQNCLDQPITEVTPGISSWKIGVTHDPSSASY